MENATLIITNQVAFGKTLAFRAGLENCVCTFTQGLTFYNKTASFTVIGKHKKLSKQYFEFLLHYKFQSPRTIGMTDTLAIDI